MPNKAHTLFQTKNVSLLFRSFINVKKCEEKYFSF